MRGQAFNREDGARTHVEPPVSVHNSFLCFLGGIFRSEESFLVAVDHYASKLDEITLWLNETENVLNDRTASEADGEQTSKLLDALRVWIVLDIC